MNQFPAPFSFTTNTVPIVPRPWAGSNPACGSATPNRLFGRLLISILEVCNSLRDIASRIDERHAEATEMLHEAALLEDALRDWAQQSPNDPALPYLIFNLAKLYSDMDTAAARMCKDALLRWLDTSFLKSACADLAQPDQNVTRGNGAV
jgi:hypothetical protein